MSVEWSITNYLKSLYVVTPIQLSEIYDGEHSTKTWILISDFVQMKTKVVGKISKNAVATTLLL
jgi:hypothetical protein